MFKVKSIVLLFLFFSAAVSGQENTYSIEVLISNLENNKGKVFIGLYDSEDTFLGERFRSAAVKITDNSCSFIFENIPEGEYAVSMFHDENDNDKMDKNFLGIPKEDYGCSNNAKGFMSAPAWKDAKFKLTANTKQHIKL